MWCATRVNTCTFTIFDLCKRPKSSNTHIRPHNIRRRDKLFLLPPSNKDSFWNIYELENINQWFKANRSSLNIEKTNYALFYKNSMKDKIPLKMPPLKIGNKIIERASSIKFLWVILDKNLSRKDHIKTVENNKQKMLACYIARNNSLMKLLWKQYSFTYSFLSELLKYCTGKYPLH